MVGQRVEREVHDGVFDLLLPGQYAKVPFGWYGCAPNGLTANLCGHHVTEHEDGTITVDPSILVTGENSVWHGFLEKGVWREQ